MPNQFLNKKIGFPKEKPVTKTGPRNLNKR